ncbi:unnamed protein product [Phytomonas sp. Hart1]|nr:unnamed protein product [Phytomonas sp. Hart1]|eukprot:CCW71198.1 unnamed protein product [Phytomonas sp. isolate Hart1]
MAMRIRDQFRRVDEKRLEEAVLELLFVLPEGLEEAKSKTSNPNEVSRISKTHKVILRKRLSNLQPRDLARMLSLLFQTLRRSSFGAAKSQPSISDAHVLSDGATLGAQPHFKEVDRFHGTNNLEKGGWKIDTKMFEHILLFFEVLMDLLPSIPSSDVVHIMEEVLPVWSCLEEEQERKDKTLHLKEENLSILRYELRRFLSMIPAIASECLHRFTFSELLDTFTRLHTPCRGKFSNAEEKGMNKTIFFEESFVSTAAARKLKIALTPDHYVEAQVIFQEHLQRLVSSKNWDKLYEEWMCLLSISISDSKNLTLADYKENSFDTKRNPNKMRFLKNLTDIFAFIEITGK